MKSILEELYYGKVYPAEASAASSEEFMRENKKSNEFMETLTKKLSEDDFKALDEYLSQRNVTSSLTQVQVFKYAFKLGSLIMTEVFMGKE
jgi:cytochrome c553